MPEEPGLEMLSTGEKTKQSRGRANRKVQTDVPDERSRGQEEETSQGVAAVEIGVKLVRYGNVQKLVEEWIDSKSSESPLIGLGFLFG